MPAEVAANIKGIDVIKDEHALKVIAAQQWGIDSFALPRVLEGPTLGMNAPGFATLERI